MKKILIIDDDRAVCISIQLLLNRSGYTTQAVHHPKEAKAAIVDFAPDLVILDMNFSIDTSGKQGLAFLQTIKKEFAHLSVILITGWGTLQLAVKGMKLGASDFLTKPWDNKHLLSSIKTVFDLKQSAKQAPSGAITDFDHIIGQSPAFLQVIEQAKRIAPTDANVLITGESGTGKELLAEAIHYQSKRADHNFVKVNLGGLSASLFESELFGHKKGAFTGAHSDRVGRFEKAHQGSIFLDEIGELPLDLQVKLLRVVQEKKYEVLGSSDTIHIDFRTISATNRDLAEMVSKSQFREDLYYRLNLISLHLPSLNSRKGDIPLLVEHFVQKMQKLYGFDHISTKASALNWLQQQRFPGNIRQLKNIVERTILLANDKSVLTKEDFQLCFENKNQLTTVKLPEVGSISLEELEKIMIQKALSFHNNHISHSARSLGITRNALYRRMEKYGLK